ncbi:MAG: MarR family transcriptional regulator [Anaerolineae bacterium]|nr:MarR family transcriptional regulator [Anaerolineae bacterium]
MRADQAAVQTTLHDSDVIEFGELLYRIGSAIRRNMRAELANLNLTMAQFGALHCLMKHPDGLTVSDLAESTHQVAPTVTGILNRLEERGLVLRKRNPNDRRHQLVSITPEGERTLQIFFERRHQQIGQSLARLSEEDRKQLFRLLNQFLSVMVEI